MRFDNLVVYLGEFGPYQKKIYFLLCFPSLIAAFQKLMWVFVAADMQHMCQSPENDKNNTLVLDNVWNISLPLKHGNLQLDRCTINETYVNSSSLVKCSSWNYDTSQYASSVVSDFDLVCDRKWLSALTMSLQMGGEFFGSVLLGIVSDKFGRKKVLLISSIMLSISGVVASFSQGIGMLIVCRIMVGFWTPGVILTAYIVGMEFVGPSKRVFAGIVTQFFFAVGYILIAVAAYFIRSWRLLTIALTVPGFLMISFYWLVPESVRWLLTNNKKDEALTLIKLIAKKNKVHLTDDFYSQEVCVENNPSASLKELMKYPNLRKRTFIVVYCWFVNTCVYYGLSLNTSNLAGNNYMNFALAAAVEFPAYVVCLYTLDRIGRRLPLCVSMIVGGIALFITPFLPVDKVIVITTLSMIGKFGISISYAILYMFSTEVFPTSVRSASCGLGSTFGRIGAMLVPFILLLKHYWLPLPPILFSIFAVTAGSLSLLLPETLGRELPDTIEESENFNRISGFANIKPKDLRNGSNSAKEAIELWPKSETVTQ